VPQLQRTNNAWSSLHCFQILTAETIKIFRYNVVLRKTLNCASLYNGIGNRMRWAGRYTFPIGRIYCYLPNALASYWTDSQISCQCVSLSHEMCWTLYRSQSSTDLHQTCHRGRVPRDVTHCFLTPKRCISAIAEVELISPLLFWKNSVKYRENCYRYHRWGQRKSEYEINPLPRTIN